MRIYLLFSFLLISLFSNAQIEVVENFNATDDLPIGWFSDGFTDTDNTLNCEGISFFANMGTGAPIKSIATPYQEGASNATDLTISYDLMIVNFSFFDGVTPVADGWGNIAVEYTTDSVSWTSVETISDVNFTSVANCTNRTATIPAADLPAGANFQLRLTATSLGGAWFCVLDNFSVTQIATTIPNCDAMLSEPANESIGAEITTSISWTNASGLPTGYKISIGTTAGGTDVADNVDVEGATSYTPTSELVYETTYFVTILPYNSFGDATDCIEQTFTTRTPPPPGASCDNPIAISTFPFLDSNTNEGYDNYYSTSPCNDTYMSGLEVVYAITPTEQSSINVRFDNIVGNRASIHVLDGCPDVAETCMAYFGSFNPQPQYYENLILEAGQTYYIVIASSIESSLFTYDLEVTMNPCVIPAIELTAVPDCDNAQYTVDIDITRFGSGETLTISDDQGSPSQQVNTSDPVNFGPYPTATEVQFTVVNDQDNSCTIMENFIFHCPPLNDECSGAYELAINADLNCDNVTTGTLISATASVTDFSTCAAIAKDVWFSFEATSTVHTIQILDRVAVEGNSSTVAFEVMEGTCDGGLSNLQCSTFYYDNIGNLTIGNTYYIRVYNTSGDSSVEFNICLGTPPPTPINDICSEAIELPASSNADCENLISGTTVSAFNSDDNTCSGNYNEVWYSFTPSNTGYYEVNLDILGGSGTTYMSFWSGTCGALTLESDCSLNSTMTNYALAGQTHYIMVRTTQGSPGVDFTLCTYQVFPPANNECNTPVLFLESLDATANNLVVGNNVGATYSNNACYSASNEGVWYAFTAQYTGPYTFNFTRIEGSGFYTVYEGDCDDLAYVSGISSCFNNGEKVINLVAGRTYKVSAHSSNPAYFEFFVYPNNLPPANDNCATATVLIESTAGTCENLISGTTLSAASTNNNDCSLGNYDVWYTFTPTNNGYYQFDLTQTSGEAALGMVLLGGNCDELEQQSVSCANLSMIENLVADSTYTLLVSSDAGNEQAGVDFDLCVAPVTPPVNNDCSNAISFLESADSTGENTVSGTNEFATYSAESCYDTNYEGVWYTFTPTYTGQYILHFMGDASYAVLEGNCDASVLVSMDCYTSTPDTFQVTAGLPYLVSVHATEVTSFDFFLYPDLQAPTNDDCATPVVLTASDDDSCNNLLSGTTVGASHSDDNSCSDNDLDVWYSFTPDNDGYYQFELTQTSGTATTSMALYSGECGVLSQESSECDNSSMLQLLSAGTSYSLMVQSDTTSLGVEFDLCAFQYILPSNNDCIDAETFIESLDEMGDNLVSGTTENAFNSPEACYEETYEGVWYAFTAEYTGTYTVNFNSLSGDATYAVFSGDCEDLTLLQDTGDCYSSGESLIAVEAGATYIFSVHAEEVATFEFFVYLLDDVSTDDLVATKGLQYFPNPLTSGQLTVTAEADITSIEVFNALGQQVMWIQSKATQHLLDMSNLSAGIYFLNIEIDGQNQTVKVFKE